MPALSFLIFSDLKHCHQKNAEVCPRHEPCGKTEPEHAILLSVCRRQAATKYPIPFIDDLFPVYTV